MDVPTLQQLVQAQVSDFLYHSGIFLVFIAWLIDFCSGTIVAVRKNCWNSQDAERGFFKFFTKWLWVVILSWICRKTGTPQGETMGLTILMAPIYTNVGSALENLGVIHNDQTLRRCAGETKTEAQKNLEIEIQKSAEKPITKAIEEK